MRRIRRFTILLVASLLLVANKQSAFSLQEPPGVGISGHVRTEEGQGLAGVAIYLAVAVYWPGAIVAITGPDGFYESDFAVIPGDETMTAHAERACYVFVPANETWRHYYGHEERTIDFAAHPMACNHNYLPYLNSGSSDLILSSDAHTYKGRGIYGVQNAPSNVPYE